MDTSERRKFFQQQCAPVFKEYQFMREFLLFQQQDITNIYVVPSHSSAFKWFGVIFIHDGIYHGAVLKFTLLIPNDYPCHEHPKLMFDTIPFHPLVNPKTGELNTGRDFPVWNPNINHLWQIILLAKMIFIRLDKELEVEATYTTSINSSHELGEMFFSKAVKLYREDFDSYRAKVAETIANCHSKLYDLPREPDLNAIVFGPWNPEQHEDLRQKLLTGQVPIMASENHDSLSSRGYSWVQKDSMQMFSKPAI